MENNQPKKKKASITALIALLLIVTTIASCLGIWAWARYISSQDGSATAQIAKWSFNVSLKAGSNQPVELGTGTIDLATTQYNHVENGMIAPGTAGEFDVIIDTTNTEVDLQYDVTITLSNCPRNITFSKKGPGEQSATPVSAGGASNPASLERTISFSKYVTKTQNGVFTEKIYWNWPYESDADDNWDARDNADQGRTVGMVISVTGTEKLSNPNAPAANSVEGLAKSGAIQRYDVISNYSPTGTINTSGLNVRGASIIGNTKVAALNGASIDGTIDASKATDWVVLDVNQSTGEVLIIPRTIDNPELTLSGIDGYNNAIDAIESVASIYGNSPYAQSVQSMNIELVNRLEEKNWSNADIVGNTTASYDTNYTLDENYNIQEESGRITIPESMAYYDYSLAVTSGLFCWLASRCVNPYPNSDDCYFLVRYLHGVNVENNYGLFRVNSSGSTYASSDSWPVLPVVTLKSDVLMDMGDPFYTETATATTSTQQVTEFVHHSWTLR